jgi:hypothetical protein
MKKQNKYFIFILLTLTLCISSGNAFEKVGTTSFQFLKVMTSARYTAMGEAASATAFNSQAVFFNPAGLSYVKNIDVAADYLDWFLDISHMSFSAAYTVPGLGSFGLQALLTDVGEIRVTSVDALGFVGDKYLGYTGEVIKPGAMVFGISYAKMLTEKFSFGLTAKYAHEDLGVKKTGNIMFDGGLIYNTGFKSIKLAATIRNFGPDVKYFDEEIITRYDAENDTSYTQQYTGKEYPLPQNFNIGISAYLISGGESLFMDSENQSLLVAFDMVQPRDFDQQYNLGLEYGFRNILFLRGGYKINYDSESFSLGFGIAYSGISVDYSYSDFGDYLDSVHRFSFGFAMND